jgi:hypothetical protein
LTEEGLYNGSHVFAGSLPMRMVIYVVLVNFSIVAFIPESPHVKVK